MKSLTRGFILAIILIAVGCGGGGHLVGDHSAPDTTVLPPTFIDGICDTIYTREGALPVPCECYEKANNIRQHGLYRRAVRRCAEAADTLSGDPDFYEMVPADPDWIQ